MLFTTTVGLSHCLGSHSLLTKSLDANSRKDECFVGGLSEDGVRIMTEDSERAAEALAKLKAQRRGLALQPDVFVVAKLIRRQEVSADSRCAWHVHS